MTQGDAGLLACPLCQSDNVVRGFCFIDGEYGREDAMRCQACGCRATWKAWNTRATPPEAGEALIDPDTGRPFLNMLQPTPSPSAEPVAWRDQRDELARAICWDVPTHKIGEMIEELKTNLKDQRSRATERLDAMTHDRDKEYERADNLENELAELRASPSPVSDARREALRTTLKEHWITAIKCDHEAHTDMPICYCCERLCDPQPTLGAAVDRWIDHVISQFEAALAKSFDNTGGGRS